MNNLKKSNPESVNEIEALHNIIHALERVRKEYNALEKRLLETEKNFQRWQESFEKKEPIHGVIENFPDSERKLLHERSDTATRQLRSCRPECKGFC